MSRSSLGVTLLALGILMIWLFTFSVDLPGGATFLVVFFLGVIPVVLGVAFVRSGRRSRKRSDSGSDRISGIKDQIVWRAMAQGGRITAAEAATHAGVPQPDVELALMALVSDGRAAAEPGEAGEIIYRIE